MPWLFGIPSFHSDSLKEMLRTSKGKLKSKPVEPSTLVSQCCSQADFWPVTHAFPLDPRAGRFKCSPKCLFFISLPPCFCAFSARKPPLGGTWCLNLSETLGISGIRRKADHVKAENKPNHVLVHVWIAWASVLSHLSSHTCHPLLGYTAHTSGSSLNTSEPLHYGNLCFGGNALGQSFFALCYMINRFIFENLDPIDFRGGSQGCV